MILGVGGRAYLLLHFMSIAVCGRGRCWERVVVKGGQRRFGPACAVCAAGTREQGGRLTLFDVTPLCTIVHTIK